MSEKIYFYSVYVGKFTQEKHVQFTCVTLSELKEELNKNKIPDMKYNLGIRLIEERWENFLKGNELYFSGNVHL
jgi:hypothetical protein